MITVEEARELILANLPGCKIERVWFQETLGRVLAEDLRATSDIPPFNRSAMDGYAVRAVDVERAPAQLEVVGEVRAGGDEPGVIQSGQAMAIMTGAPVPEGADAVQIVEQTEVSASRQVVTVLRAVRSGENIAPKGSEAVHGEVVLEAGRVVGAGEMAVLASFGHCEVKVWARPRVALLSTGDELVEVDQVPRSGQIRNSNAYSLSGQLRLMGLSPEYLGIARDDKDDLRLKILDGLQREVLILTGGVSMGEYDFVTEIFRELELEIVFTKVAMKPGKPTVFARKGDKLVFGLAGNPVSTFVAFENFVRPALGRLCGLAAPDLPRIRGELLRDVKQTPGRTAFLPAWISWVDNGWRVEPLKWKGSADIVGFSKANGTLIFPEKSGSIRRGESVEAMLFPDFFVRRRSSL